MKKVFINVETTKNCLPHNTFFVHGNLASNRWWDPLLAVFKNSQVNKTGSAFCAEFRGCGKSEAPSSLDEVSMSLFASDFISEIEKLGLKDLNLVGHSTGGLIAVYMMAQRPDLFSKAILLDPVGAQGVTFDPAMLGAFEAMKSDKALTEAVIGSTIYKNDPTNVFFKQHLVEDAFSAVKAVGAWVLQALDRLDSRSIAQSVSTPTLVLHGEHDVLLPMQDSVDLSVLLQKGQYKTVEGQGHCTNVEQPEKLASIMNDFLF